MSHHEHRAGRWMRAVVLALAAGLGAFGLTACFMDDDAPVHGYCGDGITNGDEQCDLTDLGFMTCADVVPGSTGILGCAADCTYDTFRCSVCGDGISTPGEQCDCGTDPSDLPDGCTDVNGGQDANCDETCHKIAYCGDGLIDAGELCDCGTDPNNLPDGCDDVNGGANGDCDESCDLLLCGAVEHAWRACDSMAVDDCCPDPWGAPMECTSLASDAFCLRPCSADAECYWNNTCVNLVGACEPELCGTGDGWANDNVGPMGRCQITGGGAAVCLPLAGWRAGPTAPPAGHCVGEADATQGKAPGEPCTMWDDVYAVDRSEMDLCRFGECLPENQGDTTGTCVQYCSWEAAYDHAFHGAPAPAFLECPAGTACVGLETIDPATGLTVGDFGRCFAPQTFATPDGITACDLVTGRLVSDPNTTCASDTHFTSGVCAVLQDPQTGGVTNGSLIGACMDGPNGGNVLSVWDDCDPSNATDICPPQTVCVAADVFAAPPTRHEKCIPYCDVDHPDCVAHIAAMGGPSTFSATPVCASESEGFPPNGPLDLYPSRVGLCAVPGN